MFPALSLLLALLIDTVRKPARAVQARRPRQQLGPDLRSRVEEGIERHGASAASIAVLWEILAEPMHKGDFPEWPIRARVQPRGPGGWRRPVSPQPGDVDLPPVGLRTRFDPIVPWILGELQSPRGQRPRVGWPGADAPMPVAIIADWAIATGTDLEGLSWEAAGEAGRRWYAEQVAHVGRRQSVPDASTLVRWPDGGHIDRLVQPVHFDEEGLSSNHCLRRHLHYYDDVILGDIVIIGYRDPWGVPQATVEVDIRDPGRLEVVQLQGPANGSISDPAARARIAWFLVEYLGISAEDLGSHWGYRVDLAAGRRFDDWGWTRRPSSADSILFDAVVDQASFIQDTIIPDGEDMIDQGTDSVSWVLDYVAHEFDKLFAVVTEFNVAFHALRLTEGSDEPVRQWGLSGIPDPGRLSLFEEDGRLWMRLEADLPARPGSTSHVWDVTPPEDRPLSNLPNDPLELLMEIGAVTDPVDVAVPAPRGRVIEADGFEAMRRAGRDVRVVRTAQVSMLPHERYIEL